MGMFDEVEVKVKLPQPEDPKGYTQDLSPIFQTKDLKNELLRFVIDESGSFLLIKSNYKYHPGNPDAKDIWEKIGYDEFLGSTKELYQETCTIYIYDYIVSDESPYDYEIEYKIVILNGKVQDISLILFNAFNNAKRKLDDLEWKREMAENYRFRQTKTYKYLVRPHNKCVDYIFRKLYKLNQFFSENLWRLERKLKK